MSGIFPREGSFSIIIDREAIILALPKMDRPLWRALSGADKIETEHPLDRGVAFRCHIVHIKSSLAACKIT
jgi:carbon monoxide dehydrogenase subunit G